MEKENNNPMEVLLSRIENFHEQESDLQELIGRLWDGNVITLEEIELLNIAPDIVNMLNISRTHIN